eukprot:scaffold10076_cov69-Cyclotella_meneghiniana.AAC.6
MAEDDMEARIEKAEAEVSSIEMNWKRRFDRAGLHGKSRILLFQLSKWRSRFFELNAAAPPLLRFST